jgi:2,4-dienoyl-CoA reductase-like NADH-dependent reductase (Old Yellow Enzyme family)
MADLFSPLTIAGRVVPNRIVMGPTPSELTSVAGFVGAELVAYYARAAQGGVGMIVSEPCLVIQPTAPTPHLGLYNDVFVPGIARLISQARSKQARIFVSITAPTPSTPTSTSDLMHLTESFIMAAWRVHCAGADGIMLSVADGCVLHLLASPLTNERTDRYGGDVAGRLRMLLEIIEGVRAWIGPRLLIGVRMPAEELTPGGMSLQDARVLAKRVTGAGAKVLDVTAPIGVGAVNLALFPGWAVPLIHGIKRIVDVPVIGSGQLGDPFLADSVVRDGSLDLVMLNGSLRSNPDWPRQAYAELRGGE